MDHPPPSLSVQTTSPWAPTTWRLSSITTVEKTSSSLSAMPPQSSASQVTYQTFSNQTRGKGFYNVCICLKAFIVTDLQLLLHHQTRFPSPYHSPKSMMSTRTTRTSSRTKLLLSASISMIPASISTAPTSASAGTLVTALIF